MVSEALAPDGSVIRLSIARTPFERLAGLAGLRELEDGNGLLIPRCRSVHTVGMRFALDVSFGELDAVPGDLRLLVVHRAVPPWRMVSHRASALRFERARVAALELAAGHAARLRLSEGAVLRIGARSRTPTAAPLRLLA